MEKHLNENGIGTLIHYPVPMHLQKAYEDLGFKEGDYPIAETISKQALSLPLWVGMADKEVDYVIDKVNLFLKKHIIVRRFSGL